MAADSAKTWARVNGSLLMLAGLALLAVVSRLPLKLAWAQQDVKVLAAAALGVVLGAVLVRSGFLVRRKGR